MCHSSFHEQDVPLIKTQFALDELLKGCNGVGGHVGHGGMESEGLGKAKGGIGGIGEEYEEQHVGKVWRFEEGGGSIGGTGVDSSEEKLGTDGIDSRILLGGIAGKS